MKRIILLPFLVLLFACDATIENLPADISINDSFLEDFWISAIAFEEDGTAWLGTVQQGLIRVKNGKTKIFDATNSNIPDSLWINDIEIDASGNVWIAANGVIKYDGTDFTQYLSERTDKNGNTIRDLEIGRDNELWLAGNVTDSEISNSVDGLDWQTTPVDIQSQEGIITIYSIAIDHDDNVWMSINGRTVNSAFLAKYNGDKWTTYGADELGFQPYWIKDIAIDSKNKVWGVIDYSLSSTFFDYRPLLFSFDGTSGKSYLPGEDFTNFLIASKIMIDAHDRVWVAGTRSISVMENESWISNFTLPNERTVLTFEARSADEVWVGTDRGVTILDVDEVLE